MPGHHQPRDGTRADDHSDNQPRAEIQRLVGHDDRHMPDTFLPMAGTGIFPSRRSDGTTPLLTSLRVTLACYIIM
nr:hypothetical protein [Candidatus Sigynarchaeota archaeon]